MVHFNEPQMPPPSIETFPCSPCILCIPRTGLWCSPNEGSRTSLLILKYCCQYQTFTPVLHVWKLHWSNFSPLRLLVGALSQLSLLLASSTRSWRGGGGCYWPPLGDCRDGISHRMEKWLWRLTSHCRMLHCGCHLISQMSGFNHTRLLNFTNSIIKSIVL